ncbi:MAG TPA: 3-hydroxyacyl-CoA dehydrogenase NAD-binding domain-containing protein [Bryobacteraceae bacterium]|jgi:3-hydroxyacyl-CoA dehydrogenase
MRTISRVAVLGSGTMGSRIAAHFANAGIPSLLLDLTAELARKGIEGAVTQRPGGFFVEQARALVTVGSFDADLARVAECDWVIEAVTENLAIKRELWGRVEKLAKHDAILSTNTSGIPLRQIAEGFSHEFRLRFCGTHFFNPPRYLHLLEVIPGPETDPAVLEFVSRFGERRLGKGIVLCKDTPNFIGNRVGFFLLGTIAKIAVEDEYSVEEVDALTGSLIGLPNSATFRLLDIVGLDVAGFVGDNLYALVPEDPWRERYLLPEFHKQMVGRGWLGEKSGQGYFKRVGKEREIHALDLKTLEYHPAAKPKFPAVEAAKGLRELPERLRTLVAGSDRAGTFLWKVFRDYLVYSAEQVPGIADRIVEIDRAMRWGYGHKLGPFELWDALGFEDVCGRLEAEGRELPGNVSAMRRAGASSFYGDGGRTYFDFASGAARAFDTPGIVLSQCARVAGNPGASLVDVGDGVLCLEFHSKMNTLGEDQFRMIAAGLAETEKNFEALIIANQGDVFSAGANLALVLLSAQNGEFDELGEMIHRFQQMMLAIKYAKKPVVAAPFSRVLGGGAEVCLHSCAIQASAETYIGLVEVGVGVIPAAGGCKEMLLREADVMKIAERIGQAKVSSSAEEARSLGFLRTRDRVSMNPDLLIGDAKAFALELARDYVAPPQARVKVGGEAGFAMLKLGIWSYRQGGYISDYDVVVLEKLAGVLSGGRLTGEQMVPEQYVLDLEREAFLSLCGNAKTQERIQHTLKTGKPLRN